MILCGCNKKSKKSNKSSLVGTESMLLEVQCEVSTVCDDLGRHGLLVLVHCVFWIHSQLPGHFRALLAFFCWQLYGDADFIFQQDLHLPTLTKVPKAGSMTMVFVVDWPANSPDLNTIENLWVLSRGRWETPDQQCRWPEGCYQNNLGFHYTWAVPQAGCLHATPHDAVIHAKGGPTKYWMHRNEHTFQKPVISG